MKKKLLSLAILFASALGGNLYAQAQWMNGLNDNIYISQMSLPGAHNAAAKSVLAGVCQDKDIAGLWDAGVRVFDLRPSDSGDDCMIYHGNAITGNTGVTLKEAFTTINGRLSSNTSEFAIVLMRKESGGDSWASKVANVISQFSNVMPFRKDLRLGDVRGKILVLSRDYFADGYKIDYWTDNTTRDVRSANSVAFVVQDYYEVTNTTDKSTAITSVLAEARANNSTNRMFINHTSGYTGSTGTNNNINSNANTSNSLALNTIDANPGPTGIILMDYAGSNSYNGANLVSKIIAQNNLLAATWTAPAAPGEDLLALSESTDVFVYNIEADAIFSRGFDWLTMALADRPEGGDNAVPANRQKTQIRRVGDNLRIHFNDRDGSRYFGQDNNSTAAGNMWTDQSDENNRVLFTPAFSSNYPNAYTLTNVLHNQKVDVLWGRGGKLTLFEGKGFYDWVFLSGDAFTSGKLAQFKVRKAMWNLYQALVKADAVSANAAALNTAYAVYTNDNASTDDLRAAFRTMFLAVASSIEDPVDVSYIFTHPDMSGDKTAAGWTYSDFAFSAGECEKYHATFSSTQTITDAPNGLYDVTMTGIYRQDDGQNNQAAPQLIVSNGTTEMTGDFPNMDLMGGKWNIGGNETGDWVNSSTGKMPKWMWSASDAQAHDEAGVKIENVKVQDYTLGVTFKVTGGNQWFNFQRIFVTYKGSINAGLYKSLQDKIAEAESFVTANTGVIPASFLTAINNAVSAASGLTANSTEEALTDAVDAINAALTAANAAPSIAKLDELQALIDLAQAEGINTTAAEAVVANPTTLAAVTEQIDILNNARVLAATIALAKTEGINTSAAEAVIATNPLTADAVNGALNAVRTARRLNAVDKQPDIFTGSAPENEGQYYIYNVGAQRYLTGGVNYGTHAAVNYAAQIATFTKSGDGWRIHTNIRTNSDALNHNGYVDCGGDGDTWYLIEASTGVYNISQTNSNTGATLLGYSGERRGNWWQVDTDNQGADQAINQWKLVSKAERDALMANASDTNPVDATYYIHAAGFDSWLNDAQLAFPLNQWQTWFPEGKGGNNGVGGWDQDRNWEAWNAGNIKFYQELTGLTPGKYRLTAQAYYRHGNFEQAVSEFNNPKTDGAILYATNGNGETAQTYIVPITSEVDKVPGYGRSSSVGSFPDDRNETAAQFFEAGLYKNVVNDIIVTADGTLTIGIEKFENEQPSEWVVADNWRLTYLGLAGVEIGDANYTTFVAPYNISEFPDGVEAFACQVQDEYVHLEPVTAIPAGVAVVLKNEGTYKFSPASGSVELGTANDLLPSDGTVQGASNIYALAKKGEPALVGFYPVESTVYVPAGKGYLDMTGHLVKPFYGFDEDDATGLSRLNLNVNLNEAIYNLAGQRMSKKQKGVNIVNGKKIIK